MSRVTVLAVQDEQTDEHDQQPAGQPDKHD